MSRSIRRAISGLALALALAPAGCGPAEKAPEQSEAAAPPAAADARPPGFAACSVCHSPEPGKNTIGPSLFAIVGRTSGTVPGFAYSPAMKEAGIVWDAPTIDRFIASPHAVVPGTKMAYPGLKDESKRAQIVAYLATLK